MRRFGWRWLAFPVLIAACEGGPVTAPPEDTRLLEAFDLVWDRYDRIYPSFEYKGIDWNAARSLHREAARTSRNGAELAAVVRTMLAPLRDVHAWTVSPQGTTISSYVPGAFVNWRRTIWDQELDEWGVVRMPGRWGFARMPEAGNIPYIYFEAWGRDFPVAQFDSVLETWRDSPALIIDVRMNGGGSSSPALDVAARFFDQPRTYEFVQFRNGPAHGDLTSMQPHAVVPRGLWQFRNPVLVLTGRGCFSSTESFILALKSLPHVTIAGDSTGGGSANPALYDLVDGWSYSVPRWISYDPDHNPVELLGVSPDLKVSATAADFDAGRDPLLDFARLWAAGITHRLSPPDRSR